jgi:hypothetical protein
VDLFLQASFSNGKFLTEFPASMEKWIRRRFSDEVFLADSKIALRKLDAFGNRLPPSLGASVIYRRCQTLRSLVYQPLLFRTANDFFGKTRSARILILGPLAASSHAHVARAAFIYLYLLSLPIAFSLRYLLDSKSTSTTSLPTLILAACLLTIAVMPILSLLLRDHPTPLSFRRLTHILYRAITSWNNLLNPKRSNFGVYALLLAFATLIVWGIFRYEPAALIFFGLLIFLALTIVIFEIKKKRESLKRLDHAVGNEPSIWAQIKLANGDEELLLWLRVKSKEWLSSSTNIRSILRYVEVRFGQVHSLSSINPAIRPYMETKSLNTYLLARLESIQEKD